jgi:predicted RNA-binding Zn ribbon-like protein
LGNEIRLLRAPKIKYKPGCCLGWGSPGWRIMAQKQNFSFLADHLSLDFVGTEFRRSGEYQDQLETFDNLRDWLKQAGLLATPEAVALSRRCSAKTSERVLGIARELRKAIRTAVEAILDGKPVPPGPVRVINNLLIKRDGHFQIERRSAQLERRFVSEMGDPLALLAPLAESAADLLCEANLALIRKCADESCDLLFYDSTKNHRRRWCSMSACGNRAKVAAHRARRRAV